jgi:hypothetical protein
MADDRRFPRKPSKDPSQRRVIIPYIRGEILEETRDSVTVTRADGVTVTYTREQWKYLPDEGDGRGEVEKKAKRGWFSHWGKWAVTAVFVPIVLALIAQIPELKELLKSRGEGCHRVEAGDPMRAVYNFEGQTGLRVVVEVNANGSVGTNGGGRRLSLVARILVNNVDHKPPATDEKTDKVNLRSQAFHVNLEDEIDITAHTPSIVLLVEKRDPGNNLSVQPPYFRCEYLGGKGAGGGALKTAEGGGH